MQGPALMSYLSSYCKLVSDGLSINHKDEIRSGTVAGYMKQVNELFRKRDLSIPIDFRSKENPVAIMIDNLRKEEVVANRRDPFTPQMIAEFLRRGDIAHPHSFEALVKDLVISGREIGYRASEISQTASTKPNYHTYPRTQRKVIKSICEDWWTAYDVNNNVINDILTNEDAVHKMRITWLIQKNRQNGEKLTYARDTTNELFCVPRAIISMIRRARDLNQPSHLPLSVYKDSKGAVRYLTCKSLNDYIKQIAKAVHPNITAEDLSKLTIHSMRVLAAVLLHEAGKRGDYIKKRLRWLSDSYRIYLRDTELLAVQHNSALGNYADIIDSLRLSQVNLPPNSTNTVVIDHEMGDYIDIG